MRLGKIYQDAVYRLQKIKRKQGKYNIFLSSKCQLCLVYRYLRYHQYYNIDLMKIQYIFYLFHMPYDYKNVPLDI